MRVLRKKLRTFLLMAPFAVNACFSAPHTSSASSSGGGGATTGSSGTSGACIQSFASPYCDAGLVDFLTCEMPCGATNFVCPGFAFTHCGNGVCVPTDGTCPALDGGGCTDTQEVPYCDAGFVDLGTCGVPCGEQNGFCSLGAFTDCGSGTCATDGGTCPAPDAGQCFNPQPAEYCDAGFIDLGTCEVPCSAQNAFCNLGGFTDCGSGTCANIGQGCPLPDGGQCMNTQSFEFCDAGFIDLGTCEVPCNTQNAFCGPRVGITDCGGGACVEAGDCPGPVACASETERDVCDGATQRFTACCTNPSAPYCPNEAGTYVTCTDGSCAYSADACDGGEAFDAGCSAGFARIVVCNPRGDRLVSCCTEGGSVCEDGDATRYADCGNGFCAPNGVCAPTDGGG